MTTDTLTRYTVTHVDEDTGKSQAIGVVTLDADHKLGLVSATPDRQEFLEDIVTRTNGLDVLHVDVAPPPDAPRGSLFSRITPRADSGFRKALMDRLKAYYDLELTPL